MSAVALILNLLLGALLMAALGLGWRLERRLKALRDSQQTFIQAIGELDKAAARAEQGLADLRAATDEAAETLAGRIDRAQALSNRLDSAIARAPAAAEPARARFEAPRAPAEPPRDIRTDLILEDVPARRPFSPIPPPLRAQGLSASPQMQPQRSRARVDDDLFDDAGPARTALGVRR